MSGTLHIAEKHLSPPGSHARPLVHLPGCSDTVSHRYYPDATFFPSCASAPAVPPPSLGCRGTKATPCTPISAHLILLQI